MINKLLHAFIVSGKDHNENNYCKQFYLPVNSDNSSIALPYVSVLRVGADRCSCDPDLFPPPCNQALVASSHMNSGLDHVSCFGPQDSSKHDTGKDLRSAHVWELVFLLTLASYNHPVRKPE